MSEVIAPAASGGRSGCNERMKRSATKRNERIADTCAALASRPASGAEGGSPGA